MSLGTRGSWGRAEIQQELQNGANGQADLSAYYKTIPRTAMENNIQSENFRQSSYGIISLG